MNPIVVKFGGSSLATAAQFEKVAAIIREARPAAMLSPPRRASALTAIQRSPIFFTAAMTRPAPGRNLRPCWTRSGSALPISSARCA